MSYIAGLKGAWYKAEQRGELPRGKKIPMFIVIDFVNNASNENEKRIASKLWEEVKAKTLNRFEFQTRMRALYKQIKKRRSKDELPR